MGKIRVVIADDQNLICDGIKIILDSQSDIEVVATAENGQKAVEYATAYQPDVMLLDIKMPVMSGLEALRKIKADFPDIAVIMLTTFDPDEFIISAFKEGADGFLLKDTTGDKLAGAIRDAYNGNMSIPSAIVYRIISHIPEETRKDKLSDYGLTQREIEIAGLIAKGYNNEKIAKNLDISLGTTKNYICSVYSKLEAKNRQEAIIIIRKLKNDSEVLD